MDAFASLSIWALVAGSIAGAVAHWNLASGRRAKFVRWCLVFGVVSILIFGAIYALSISAVPTRGLLGLAFIGFPAFVAGLAVLVLSRISPRSAPDV